MLLFGFGTVSPRTTARTSHHARRGTRRGGGPPGPRPDARRPPRALARCRLGSVRFALHRSSDDRYKIQDSREPASQEAARTAFERSLGCVRP
eukprot:522784-Prymnesium_polylepis.1